MRLFIYFISLFISLFISIPRRAEKQDIAIGPFRCPRRRAVIGLIGLKKVADRAKYLGSILYGLFFADRSVSRRERKGMFHRYIIDDTRRGLFVMR